MQIRSFDDRKALQAFQDWEYANGQEPAAPGTNLWTDFTGNISEFLWISFKMAADLETASCRFANDEDVYHTHTLDELQSL